MSSSPDPAKSTLRSFRELIDRLDAIEDPREDPERVTDVLSAVDLSDAELEPFLNWSDDNYTRNLVRRAALYDLLVLCWKPGQSTPIHDHGGQHGWVRVLSGRIEEAAYQPIDEAWVEWEEGDAPEQEAPLRSVGQGVIQEGPAVVSVDLRRGIHSLGNPSSGQPAVTLHVYSRPHDSCLVFDLEKDICRQRKLSFDTGPDPRFV